MAQRNQVVEWRTPPTSLRIEADEIHVWRAALDLSVTDVKKLANTLSTTELQRAGRFRFEREQRRFIVRRGILRTLLGRYVDALPRQVALAENAYGKPFLAQGAHKTAAVEFNLSHADEVTIYVFARRKSVGIDIERIRPFAEADAICRKHFARQEWEVLNGMTGDQYWQAFYNCWTRKEAYLKAEGNGLFGDLESSVGVQAMSPFHRRLRLRKSKRLTCRWTFMDFIPVSGYQAALALSGSFKAIHYCSASSSLYDDDQIISIQSNPRFASQSL